jgi:hypothetical protein
MSSMSLRTGGLKSSCPPQRVIRREHPERAMLVVSGCLEGTE